MIHAPVIPLDLHEIHEPRGMLVQSVFFTLPFHGNQIQAALRQQVWVQEYREKIILETTIMGESLFYFQAHVDPPKIKGTE